MRTSLNSLITHQSHSNILYSKQKLYEWGNKPSEYLAHLTKSNSDSQFITYIVDPMGVRYFDSLIINNIFKQFYSVLYQSHHSSQKHDYMVSIFDCLTLPVVSEEQRELLNAPISREEAITALHSLKSGKSPGPDGLACEFYKEFEYVLLDPLLAMLNHSFLTDRLPPSFHEANISLI